jgi:hypothetical protein
MSGERATWVLASVLLTGCATYARGGGEWRASATGMDGRTSQAPVEQTEPYGYTVEVEVRGDLWRGELVGCDAKGIYLLLHEAGDGAEQYLTWGQIRDGEVQLSGTSAWSFLVWGLLGAGSAVSHGLMFIGTGPTWGLLTLITSLAYGVADSGESFPDGGPWPERCCELARWSRFPQGVPVDIARRYRGVADDEPAMALGRVPSCTSRLLWESAPPAADSDDRTDPPPSSFGLP